ncbi:hypothetical protein [Actinomadura sp. 3N407]
MARSAAFSGREVTGSGSAFRDVVRPALDGPALPVGSSPLQLQRTP